MSLSREGKRKSWRRKIIENKQGESAGRKDIVKRIFQDTV